MRYKGLENKIDFRCFMRKSKKNRKRVFKDFGIGKRRKGSTAPELRISASGRIGSNCKFKQRFEDKIEADLYAIEYNNERVLMFSPVESYRCLKHNCWHIGHGYEKRRVPND